MPQERNTVWIPLRQAFLTYKIKSAIRLEDKFERGIPDLNVRVGNVEWWIEMKACQVARTTGQTFVGLEPHQAAWILNQTRCGRKCAVVARVAGVFCVWAGRVDYWKEVLPLLTHHSDWGVLQGHTKLMSKHASAVVGWLIAKSELMSMLQA